MKTTNLAIALLGVVCALFTLMVQAQTVANQPAESKLDTAKIDAVFGRTGSWDTGNYVVNFPRSDLRVTLHGIQLAPGHVHSYATFTGSDNDAVMMGDVCALVEEVTPAVQKLRSSGIEVTGIHDHFLGESPLLTYIHFHGHGKATELARAFLGAVRTTAAPMNAAPSITTSDAPVWLAAVQNALGRNLHYSAVNGLVSGKANRADMPSGPMDYWFGSSMNFQDAGAGKILAIGDFAITADEVNPVLSAMTDNHFGIVALHNHTLNDQPRIFLRR